MTAELRDQLTSYLWMGLSCPAGVSPGDLAAAVKAVEHEKERSRRIEADEGRIRKCRREKLANARLKGELSRPPATGWRTVARIVPRTGAYEIQVPVETGEPVTKAVPLVDPKAGIRFEELPHNLTIKQMIALGIPRSTAYDLAQKLDHFKMGNELRVVTAALRAHFEGKNGR